MRVIVCGGRTFVDVPFLWERLDLFHAKKGITAIAEGASDDVTGPYLGADYWARQWAIARDIETNTFHAEWAALGRKAGPLRNRKMVAMFKPDAVIAFPGGAGTNDMVDHARSLGINVWDLREYQVRPEGLGSP